MNRKDFLDIMENSVPIDRQILSEIEGMIATFPYFQSAYLLLLKGLYQNEDVKFGNTLRNSAVHVADREVLYHLLYSPALNETEHKISSNSEDEYVDSGQTVIESAKNSEELINTIENTSADESPVEEEDQKIPQVLIDDEEDTTDRLNNAADDDEELLELDRETETNSNIDSNGEGKPDENSDRLSQADLIDRFIIANPRIEPIRDIKLGPAEDRSVPAIEEGVFVSETLARIYISQGYYSKAIDILEKLSLKYPEKSSYFATQIEKVKELLK